MTDGIVHKVCEKYIRNKGLTYEAKNVAYQIERDLIEEIKQEFDKNGLGYNADYYNKASLLKLIGDNRD